MVERLNLEIITPERVVVSEEVDMVEAKGALGEFGILPGHVQFLTTLEIGEICYAQGTQSRCLATSGGFAEVVDNKVTFLVDTTEFAEEIDIDRARRALERAEKELKELAAEEKEYKLYELAITRAMTRISAASKKL
ncbi:MAG: ATP synthase F1 subunit epsilon [Syntrophus sp. (in: bacteria)]|nr:ATP synthase F1 subunit epsilon [Syntrophus sp. (in: bacteria)]